MPSKVRLSRRLLVRLYPRQWRRRYGEEFALLLEAAPLSAGMIANVVGAAGREWLLRTIVGMLVWAMTIAWVANLVAGYLNGLFPVAPYIEYAGFRWAPWPSYFGLAMAAVLFGNIFRYVSSLKRGGVQIGGAEFGYWMFAFLAASIGSQWSDMVTGPEQTHFEIWKSSATLLSGQFMLFLVASKRPQATMSTAIPLSVTNRK